MSEVTFPGHGEPAETCGTVIEMGCWDCQGYFTVQSKCMKKSCPDCYPDWAYRQGLHAAERMTEFLNSPDYMKVLEDAERERWEGAQNRVPQLPRDGGKDLRRSRERHTPMPGVQIHLGRGRMTEEEFLLVVVGIIGIHVVGRAVLEARKVP